MLAWERKQSNQCVHNSRTEKSKNKKKIESTLHVEMSTCKK
jgi:hypothetical protein